MDRDRVKGTDSKVAGSVKEAIGKVVGDAELEAEGSAQKTAGTAGNKAGSTGNPVRKAAKE